MYRMCTCSQIWKTALAHAVMRVYVPVAVVVVLLGSCVYGHIDKLRLWLPIDAAQCIMFESVRTWFISGLDVYWPR